MLFVVSTLEYIQDCWNLHNETKKKMKFILCLYVSVVTRKCFIIYFQSPEDIDTEEEFILKSSTRAVFP